MTAKINNKLYVLNKIREAKDILFGQFSETLTKEKKVEEWTNICKFCKVLGLVPQDKDYSYVRDVFWSNIKRSTLAKKEYINQIGNTGIKSKQYNVIDDIVLDILDKKSPAVKGIKVEVATADDISDCDISTTAEMSASDNDNTDTEDPHKCSRADLSNSKLKRCMTETLTSHEEYEDEISLRKRKLKLQIEFLTLKNYKMKLEILETERRLNITHSDFTSDILTGN